MAALVKIVIELPLAAVATYGVATLLEDVSLAKNGTVRASRDECANGEPVGRSIGTWATVEG